MRAARYRSDCPGCGSLLMQCSLIHANLLAAADYNVVGLAAAELAAPSSVFRSGIVAGSALVCAV
ncbi:DUF2752 domain-containing protein [Mycobacterium canettii]|nr:DUF2752 domain-containing protein [Mycobacterium canetti]